MEDVGEMKLRYGMLGGLVQPAGSGTDGEQ